MQSICDRAILLDGGRLAKQGTPEEVMDYYNALIAEREEFQRRTGRHRRRTGADHLRHRRSDRGRHRAGRRTGQAAGSGERGHPGHAARAVRVNAPVPRLVLGYMIKDRLGQQMFGTNTHHMEAPLADLQPGETIEYCFHFPLNLGPGSYSITTALTSSETHLADNYEWRDLAFLFIVMNMNRKVFVGSSWLEPTVEIVDEPILSTGPSKTATAARVI
jgi:lipopolysaccharide transport system ATP-binding protein